MNPKGKKLVKNIEKAADNSSKEVKNQENEAKKGTLINRKNSNASDVKSKIFNQTLPADQNRKKVLMLGWEFPPVINGGLGVACLGLSKGLSKFVDLTVILPKSDPDFIVQNVELIGLNNLNLREILKQDTFNSEAKKEFIKEELFGDENVSNSEFPTSTHAEDVKDDAISKTEYDTFADTEYVDIQIDPYYHSNKLVADEDFFLKSLTERIKKGKEEQGTTGKETPLEYQVSNETEPKSVFAFSTSYSKEEYAQEHEALQTEDLTIEKFLHAFRDGELYGEDVIQKVILYSKYVLKIAAKKDFDIIYAHDWMTFLAGIEVKEKTGKPLALHVHALDYDRGGPESKGWIFELEKFAMENADLIMPVSNYTAGVISGHYGIDPAKVFPVHNGADHVDVYKAEKGFPEKLVLFLGRVTGQKGPGFFLEVASKVFESYPKVRFVVAGTGDKLKRLIETGAYKEIGHKFHFTGFLNKERVHQLLAMTDVYCMPSVSEPFGLSALEAAQFDVPMVISKQSGVAEVLSGALSADYWDVNLMAEHIIALLKSKRLVKSVVKQSTQDLEYLTWDIAAEKIYQNFLHTLDQEF